MKAKQYLSNIGIKEDGLFNLLDLPDEVFAQSYEKIKTSFIQILKTSQFQEQMIMDLKNSPIEDMEKEKEGIALIKQELENDKQLSIEKRNFLYLIFDSVSDAIFDLMTCMRKIVEVKVTRTSEDAILPKYAHPSDAGADIYALEETVIKPHSTIIVKTGLKVAIPQGWEIQLRPRSGLSAKTPLRIANSPATIDSNFRGEIGVIVENTGGVSYTINKGDRIAQMIIAESPMIKWIETSELDETDRNESGFGSSGN